MARDETRPAKVQTHPHTAPTRSHSPVAQTGRPVHAGADEPRVQAALSLQQLAGNAAVAQLLAADETADDAPRSAVDLIARGGGSPLDTETRRSMEASFGHDFSKVRIHSGAAAAASAASIQASAYTVGTDVVLPGGIDGASHDSLHTLAHELTHVVQQQSGPVDGTPAPGGVRISDPRDRFEQEAERTADRVITDLVAEQPPRADGPA